MRKTRAKRGRKSAERIRESVELRRRGCGFHVIARRLGYQGAKRACRGVMAGLKRTPLEPNEEIRKLMLSRLDALLDALWDQATGGEGQAVDRALKVMSLRAKLLGLDAPARVEVTGTGPLKVDLTWSDDVRNDDE